MFLGLFSTHLPYIIIGIVYVFSFMVASLQFMSNGREDTDIGEMKTNQIFATAEANDCFVIQFSGPGHAFAGIIKQTASTVCPETFAQTIRTPKGSLITDHHHQIVFARPPPVFPVT